MRKKYEYLIETEGVMDSNDVEFTLNEYGKLGWELTAIYNNCFYFKRRVK